MVRTITSRAAHALALAACITVSAPAVAQSAPSGKDLYASACAACHQLNGAGVPGAFPAMARDPIVNGAPALGAKVVLAGAGPMPNFDSQLNDAQIAAVLTYVRTSFGNKASPVQVAVVTGVRKALATGR